MSVPRRLRVLRVIDRLNVGGPTKHVAWLSAGLADAGFDTTLVTGTIAAGEGDMSWFARAHGVEPVVIPDLSRALRLADLRVAWRLYRMMLRLRPDVVHTHKAKAGAVGRVAALLYRWATAGTLVGRPRRVRVVHTFHGHVFHGYYGAGATSLILAVERLLAWFATDRVVTLSPAQREEIVGRFRVGCRGRTLVVPLGLEPRETPPAAVVARTRRALGAHDGDLLVGVVGRLCEVKDHAMLIDVVAQLRRDGLPIRLAIVGDGHLREPLQRRVEGRGIADAVIFTGFVDDPTPIYAACDVVALTSRNEGTPLTLLEAMALGRPVAATAVGGVVDVLGARRVAHGEGFIEWTHGVTAPSGDVQSFAAGLRLLAGSPARRAAMGAAGRAFVRGHRGRDRLLRRMAALYRALCGVRSTEERTHEGVHHGRRGVHRLASRGTVSLAR